MKKYQLLIIMVTCTCFSLHAQKISREDYERAVSFRMPNLNNKKVYNLAIEPLWFADSSGFSYMEPSKEGKTYYKYEFKKKQTEPLFDQARFAKALGELFKTEIKPNDLPVYGARKTGKSHIEFGSRGKNYLLDINTYTIELKAEVLANPMESKSPDGQWIAYSKDNNLYLRSAKTGTVKQLSTGGFKNYEYASFYGWGDIMEGENGDRKQHFSVQWSPDSKWIQTYICDLRNARKMYLLDWSVDTLYRARLLSYYRGSPGDTDMVYMTPVLFNVETGEEIRKDELRNVNAPSYQGFHN